MGLALISFPGTFMDYTLSYSCPTAPPLRGGETEAQWAGRGGTVCCDGEEVSVSWRPTAPYHWTRDGMTGSLQPRSTHSWHPHQLLPVPPGKLGCAPSKEGSLDPGYSTAIEAHSLHCDVSLVVETGFFLIVPVGGASSGNAPGCGL